MMIIFKNANRPEGKRLWRNIHASPTQSGDGAPRAFVTGAQVLCTWVRKGQVTYQGILARLGAAATTTLDGERCSARTRFTKCLHALTHFLFTCFARSSRWRAAAQNSASNTCRRLRDNVFQVSTHDLKVQPMGEIMRMLRTFWGKTLKIQMVNLLKGHYARRLHCYAYTTQYVMYTFLYPPKKHKVTSVFLIES